MHRLFVFVVGDAVIQSLRRKGGEKSNTLWQGWVKYLLYSKAFNTMILLFRFDLSKQIIAKHFNAAVLS